MRAVFLFALALLAAACSVQPLPALEPGGSLTPSHVDMATTLASKTVALVRSTSNTDVRAYCTGVWVSDSTILTAAHCVRGGEIGDVLDYVVRADVYAPGDDEVRDSIKPHGAIITAVDVGHDLALLRALVSPPHGFALLSLEPIQPGMRVYSMGHPLGLWYSFSSGDVSAVRFEDGLSAPTLMIQTTTPISPGNSGGGLYDEWGMLVGVCHATYTRGQNANLFIHRQYITAILKTQVAL